MKRVLAADTFLIEITQEAYLWLWDWTGVYVATLMFAAYVGERFCWGRLGWFDFVLIAFTGTWLGLRYLAQSKDLRSLNAAQRAWRDFTIRPFFSAFVLGALAGDAFQLSAWHVASDAMFLTWNYLGCVQVREREPKEFFARKLARVGA
jgi:hypothetical protein